MQEVLNFMVAHWFLSLLLVVSLLCIVVLELRVNSGGIPKLSPQELILEMNHERSVIVDLRPESEYASGHILGAINLPVADFKEKISTVLKKHKKGPVILVCQLGASSPKWAQLLVSEHPERSVHVLAGGMSAWVQEQCPQVTS